MGWLPITCVGPSRDTYPGSRRVSYAEKHAVHTNKQAADLRRRNLTLIKRHERDERSNSPSSVFQQSEASLAVTALWSTLT